MNGKQVKLSLVDKTPGGFLIAGGSVAVDGGTAGTTRDIVFPLPSTAGAVALGRSCDGRVEWVSPEGSFGARESRGVEDEEAQHPPSLSAMRNRGIFSCLRLCAFTASQHRRRASSSIGGNHAVFCFPMSRERCVISAKSATTGSLHMSEASKAPSGTC